VQLAGGPLGFEEHAPVALVLHPADEAATRSLVHGAPAVGDTLYAPADGGPDPRHGDTLAHTNRLTRARRASMSAVRKATRAPPPSLALQASNFTFRGTIA